MEEENKLKDQKKTQLEVPTFLPTQPIPLSQQPQPRPHHLFPGTPSLWPLEPPSESTASNSPPLNLNPLQAFRMGEFPFPGGLAAFCE